VDDFGIGRILHKTPGEGMVAIMYLRGALESVQAQTYGENLTNPAMPAVAANPAR
jgi:hypothetical protein